MIFAYAFFQRTAPSVFVDDLSTEFQLSGAGAGALASLYYYSYSAAQIPLGMLLDRFGVLPVLTITAMLACCASLMFAVAEQLWIISIARLLVGISVGSGWISVLNFTATDPHFQRRKASATGWSMLVGLGGGVLGQGPLALGIAQSGWRLCMGVVSIVPLLISVVIAFVWRVRVVRAREVAVVKIKIGAAEENEIASNAEVRMPMMRQLRIVCSNQVNWLLFTYAIFSFSPLLAFGSLWAVPFLSRVGQVDNATAGLLASIILMGVGLGSPLSGLLSDRFPQRTRMIMLGGIFLSMISMALVLFGTGLFLSIEVVGFCMFCCGFGAAPMQLTAFFIAQKHNPVHVGAAAVAVVNTGSLLAGAFFQPLVGALLDLGIGDSGDSGDSGDRGGTENSIENRTMTTSGGVSPSPVKMELQWTPFQMRTVCVSVFMTCYVVSGVIAAFALPKQSNSTFGMHSDEKMEVEVELELE